MSEANEFQKMTMVQLRDYANRRNLGVKARTKDELIKKIMDIEQAFYSSTSSQTLIELGLPTRGRNKPPRIVVPKTTAVKKVTAKKITAKSPKKITAKKITAKSP